MHKPQRELANLQPSNKFAPAQTATRFPQQLFRTNQRQTYNCQLICLKIVALIRTNKFQSERNK